MWNKKSILMQNCFSGREFVYALYVSFKDTTKLLLNNLGDGVSKEERPGQSIVHIFTNQGILNWEVR